MDLSKLLDKVIEIVKLSAEFTKGEFTTTQKDSHVNFVTSADIAVQKFLEKELVSLLPGSAFFGEEGNESVRSAEYLWIVDPIDGTVNFSRGIDECAISVGLMQGEKAILGVIYAPFKDQLYYATLGGGAYFNGKPMKTSDRDFKSSLFCTALSLYKKEYADTCLEIMRETYSKCTDLRRFGSCALDICHLAKGECELFFEFRVFPWDYAAGFVILREAGGVITGLDGEHLQFDRTSPIIAANNVENHRKLLEIVKKYMKSVPYEEILR